MIFSTRAFDYNSSIPIQLYEARWNLITVII